MAKRDEQTERASHANGYSVASAVGLRAVVLTGTSRGKAKLIGSRLTIGKAESNDLVLSDSLVSRTHCELERCKEGILVRDLGSTNGTRLDGVRVREGLAKAGTVIGVGSVDIAVRPTAIPVDALPSKHNYFGEAYGTSLAMRSIFGLLEYAAPSEATVLLTGETGTGKDVLARSIVARSRREDQPFVVFDCGASSYSLVESELFGHERGAFTGAETLRKGAFENADGGTIFLDEIGEFPLDLQAKLLRVIETRTFQRVGSSKVRNSDVRIIAATKRDLETEVAAGRFREDLYFRLAVVPVRVPPLRERKEDIPILAERILGTIARDREITFSAEALDSLHTHSWPGNVRELRNVIERALLVTPGSVIARFALDQLAGSELDP